MQPTMAFHPFRALLVGLGVVSVLGATLLGRLPSEANPSSGGSATPQSTSAPGPSPAPARSTASQAPVLPSQPVPPSQLLLPSQPGLPTAPDGRTYPLVPADATVTAALLAQVEEALRSPTTAATDLPALGHQQQVIYRVLAHQDARAAAVRAALPERWQPVFDLHIKARRSFIAMHDPARRPTKVPAWRIQAPESPDNLLRYYREAAAATGIPWEVLAAVNLVESGMGRIDGVSVADAHGPMQFLPSTWAEPGIGNGGDIRDPRTAINAAARYLVRRGGLRDIRKGLWGYNNSDNYGTAVLAYAALLKSDPAAYRGLYHWEIHFASAAGDLWLPVGYVQATPLNATTWLQANQAGAPPPGSSGY